MGESEPLELAAVIKALRESLDQAQAEGAGHQTRFQVNDIEIEVTVAVTKGHGINGAIKFWVVQAGADASKSKVATQRIRLSLGTDPNLWIARHGWKYLPRDLSEQPG